MQLMNNVDKFLERLKTFKPLIDENKIPKKSFDATRSYLELPHFNRSVRVCRLSAAQHEYVFWNLSVASLSSNVH